MRKKAYLETLKWYHLLFVGSSTLSKSWCVPHVGQFYCFKNQRSVPGRTVAAQIWEKFFRTHHFVPWQKLLRKSGGPSKRLSVLVIQNQSGFRLIFSLKKFRVWSYGVHLNLFQLGGLLFESWYNKLRISRLVNASKCWDIVSGERLNMINESKRKVLRIYYLWLSRA